jgi:hypothetical protein
MGDGRRDSGLVEKSSLLRKLWNDNSLIRRRSARVTSPYSFGLEHLLAGFSLVSFLQRKTRSGFTIPPNSVPKSFAVPEHDLERADRALMPVFDLSQDRFDVTEHPKPVSTIEII